METPDQEPFWDDLQRRADRLTPAELAGMAPQPGDGDWDEASEAEAQERRQRLAEDIAMLERAVLEKCKQTLGQEKRAQTRSSGP